MDVDLIKNLTTDFYQDNVSSGLHFNDKLYTLNDKHTLQYMATKEANKDVCVCTELVFSLVSMGQLMVDQLIVGTTGRTALASSFMKPEPHNSSVVFLTCRELYYGSPAL